MNSRSVLQCEIIEQMNIRQNEQILQRFLRKYWCTSSISSSKPGQSVSQILDIKQNHPVDTKPQFTDSWRSSSSSILWILTSAYTARPAGSKRHRCRTRCSPHSGALGRRVRVWASAAGDAADGQSRTAQCLAEPCRPQSFQTMRSRPVEQTSGLMEDARCRRANTHFDARDSTWHT